MSDEIKPMTFDRFRELIAAYGASPEKWPDQERALAEALIATSPEAEEIIRDAAALDTALDSLPTPEISSELREGVLEIADGLKPTAANENRNVIIAIAKWYPRSNGTWLRAAAAAVVFGVLCGVGVSQVFVPPNTVIIAQPAVPQIIDPVAEQEVQNELTSFSPTEELSAALVDTGLQNGGVSEESTEEDSEIPII